MPASRNTSGPVARENGHYQFVQDYSERDVTLTQLINTAWNIYGRDQIVGLAPARQQNLRAAGWIFALNQVRLAIGAKQNSQV